MAGMCSAVAGQHVERVGTSLEVVVDNWKGIAGSGNTQLVQTDYHIAGLKFAAFAVVVLAVPEEGRWDLGRWRGW